MGVHVKSLEVVTINDPTNRLIRVVPSIGLHALFAEQCAESGIGHSTSEWPLGLNILFDFHPFKSLLLTLHQLVQSSLFDLLHC